MTVFLNAEEQREIEATSHRLKSITRRSLRWIATWQGHQSLQEGPINSVNDAEHSRVCASPGTRTKQHVIAEQDDDTLTAHVVRLKHNLEKELLACQEQAASLESQIEALQKEQEGQVYRSNEADSVPRFQESLSSEDDRDATPDRDPNPPATTAIRDREEVVIRGFVLKRTLHAVAPETLALNEVYCEEIMYANMWQEGLQCFRALELVLEPIVCRTHEDVHRPMSASSIYFLYRSGETGVAAWLHGLHLSEYIPCFTLAGLTTLEHLVHVEESTLLHTVGMLRGHVRLVLAARERLREVLIENPQVIAPRIRIDEILREIRTCMHELPHQDTLPKVVKLPKRKATSETTQHACASGTTYSTVLPGAHPIKENLESIVETRRRGSACSSGKFGQVLGQDGLWRYPERKLYARRNQVKNE